MQWPLVAHPDQFARASARVVNAENRLLGYLNCIQNSTLRSKVSDILGDLHNRRCELKIAQSAHVRKTCPQLIQRLEEQVDYNLWWGAPGAGLKSHHSYPGGWLLHNATNLLSADHLCATAEQLRGATVDRESLYAAILLHDSIKPRLFLWREGIMDVDQGECGHHVAAIAEALLHEIPFPTVVLLAGLHAGWWKNPAVVEDYIQQALHLIGEPSRSSELSAQIAEMQWKPEAWIARQAEEAWYGGTVYAMTRIRKKLGEWYRCDTESEGNRKLWRILMQVDELTLLGQIEHGEEAFRQWEQQTIRSD
jgi:hypothetical protein